MSSSANIPGIRNLLIHGRRNPDAELRVCAANNVLLPLTFGISAIGNLMATVDHDKGLAEGTLADAGYLLTFLAELVNHLQEIKDAAVYEQIHGHALEMVS